MGTFVRDQRYIRSILSIGISCDLGCTGCLHHLLLLVCPDVMAAATCAPRKRSEHIGAVWGTCLRMSLLWTGGRRERSS